MNWEPMVTGLPAQAGWQLEFGTDPDLTNHILTLSINPPGAFQQGFGFGGMTQVEVQIVDANNQRVGWGFNTDQAAAAAFRGLPPLGLANDLVAAGRSPIIPAPPAPPPVPWPPLGGVSASLAQNFMQVVTINIGNGPVAGSATFMGGPAGPLIGPNYLIQGGGLVSQAMKIEFYENGLLAGVAQIPPGFPGLNNYWDHLSLVPEPASSALWFVGPLLLIRWRRGRAV
jgi:hypothetical protein